MSKNEKYDPAKLPETKAEAINLALVRKQWAEKARENDRPGSAKEFELTALLLEFYAGTLPPASR